jgi:hypothetical protein
MSVDKDNEEDDYFECITEPPTLSHNSRTNIDGLNHLATPVDGTKYKVSLLILRERETSEEFSIKMLFDSKIKFVFNLHEELKSENSRVTLMYGVDLDVTRNQSGELAVFHEKKWNLIHTYQLYISRRRRIISNTVHYNDSQTRTLCDPLNDTLNFILDANFHEYQLFSSGIGK